MLKPHPQNERVKRDYFLYLRHVKGKSEATIDAIAKAILRFETQTKSKDFKTFRREQAIAFKASLDNTKRKATGEPLAISTQLATMNALREFFAWLCGQSGYKSKIHVADVEYFSLTQKEVAIAKSSKFVDFPSLEQIRHVIESMPTATVIERRDRALFTFAVLTGIRNDAMASLSLRHVDMRQNPPLVMQQPDRVRTKFSSTINTFFLPLGSDLHAIVSDWIDELKTTHLFGPNDPLFPKTKMGISEQKAFMPDGLEKDHWSNTSPIRRIFKQAFENAGLAYYHPHSFRHTLGHLAQTMCQTPEEFKAWSQNLGHKSVMTTLTAYGILPPRRQGEVLAGLKIISSQSSNEM